jgi:parallel beta-helix repeat protein
VCEQFLAQRKSSQKLRMKTRNLWPLACLWLGLATASAQTNLALLVSLSGDYIGQGQTYVTTNQADISISGTPSTLTINAFGFAIYFSGPNRTPLTDGTYTDAAGWPFNGAQPGLSVFGHGDACDTICGEFRILELHTNSDGNVDRFWATFTQVCECSLPPLLGEIRYNSQLAPVTPRTLRVPSQFATIQSALDAASMFPGDTILVDPGVYRENPRFNGRNAQVISTGGPDVTFIAPPNSPGVQFSFKETRQALLSGFTITNCSTAIDIVYSSPTLVSNVIRNCGQGIACLSSSPLIRSNTIISCGNVGIYVAGAASTTVIGNLIQSNYVGIWMFTAGNPSIYNNLIQGSQNEGLSLENYSDADIYQNIVIENGGNGIYWEVPDGYRGPRVINNTICNNGGAGISSGGFQGNVRLANNVIVGAPALNIITNDSSQIPIIQFNDIFSWTRNAYSGAVKNLNGVSGNISADPLFACPLGDFHIRPGSPCVDAGDNTVLSNSPTADFDSRNRIIAGPGGAAIVDMGAFEFDQSVAIPTCVYIMCPTNMTASAPDQNGVAVEFPTPIAPPGATVICSPPSGTIFLPGTNVVFCTANMGSVTDSCAFTITVAVAPPNDLAENATVISSFPFEEYLDASGATRGKGDSNCSSSGGTVWYKFKSKKNQEITISTYGSDFDAGLTVCLSPRKGAHIVACGLVSVSFNALVGHTYYVMAGANEPVGKGQLHFTATSQPILKAIRVHANIARTATFGPGWSEYHGTVTSTRPTTVDIRGTVWASVWPWNIMVDSFHDWVWCGGRSASWDIEGYPMLNFTGGSVRVILSYYSRDELNSSSGHSTTEVNLMPVNDRRRLSVRRAFDEKPAAR